MTKIPMSKVSSEELDRMLGVSKDTNSRVLQIGVPHGASSDELDRMLCSDTTDQ